MLETKIICLFSKFWLFTFNKKFLKNLQFCKKFWSCWSTSQVQRGKSLPKQNYFTSTYTKGAWQFFSVKEIVFCSFFFFCPENLKLNRSRKNVVRFLGKNWLARGFKFLWKVKLELKTSCSFLEFDMVNFLQLSGKNKTKLSFSSNLVEPWKSPIIKIKIKPFWA